MNFYRYTLHSYGSLDEFENVTSTYRRLELATYPLIRETPKGYWIGNEYSKRWVSKTARKRFAYPTTEQALDSYILRTKRCISILKARTDEAEEGLYIAEQMQKDAQPSVFTKEAA